MGVIVFTGQTGQKKFNFAEQLARIAAQKRYKTEQPPSLDDRHIRDFIWVREIDDPESMGFGKGSTIFDFLASDNEGWGEDKWRDGLEKIAKELEIGVRRRGKRLQPVIWLKASTHDRFADIRL